ncbi:SWPV1-208 [Shearwaterpox virus]|uniref:SWPV1-208 n=1 Tax=Shearwaterpox virus TaxID=1974596 RepID=A0A1V0S827_CNPV|nr:SWPV1-208 [Shearwaterpox virus]
MGFSCIDKDNNVLVHVFSKSYFETFKKGLLSKLNLHNVDDIKRYSKDSKIFCTKRGAEVISIKDRKSTQVVFKDVLKDEVIKELKELIYSDLKSSVDDIIISNTVTLVVYDKGDYFRKHKDFSSLFSRNTTCAHLLLYLEKPEIGGETAIYLGYEDTSSLKVTSDVIFDKTISHESLTVTEGRKCIALFDVILKSKLSPSTNKIASIQYLDSEIPLYDRENNLELCYCDMEIKRLEGDRDHIRAGFIFDRSGRCVKVHYCGEPLKSNVSFRSFKAMCAVHMIELDDIWMGKDDHIVWSRINEDDTSFIPTDPVLYDRLLSIATKEHSENKDLRGFCNSETEYIYCSVSKFYFNLPNESEIIDKIISKYNTEIVSIDGVNWTTLPIEMRREILCKMSYKELFSLLRGPIELVENSTDSDSD